MKTLNNIFVLFALILPSFGALVASEIPGKPQDHPIALVGGTVHTVSGAVVESGTILFEKGKITSIGTDVTLPQGTESIDMTGKHVYPGMVDARSEIGLVEIDAARATRDVSEVGTINPNIRAEVAMNPESEIIPVTRANGITTALTMPSGGTISGTAAAIMLDGWTWEEMTLKAPAGLVVNWPSMTITKAWWERRTEDEQKKARDKALDELRDAFRDARAYMKAKQAELQKNIPYHKTDLRWEAMIPMLEGKVPVLVNAEEIQQIEAAIAWAEQEGLKLVILGGYDSWRVADLLKAKDVSVIVNPIHRTPWRRWEPYDVQFTIPKKLHDAGVRFCIASGGASNERNLPYQAATAASYGLPKDEALKAVTLYPAQILGVGDRVGSLEVGKDATLIVTNGDPLEITTNVLMEFIQGKTISLQSRHTHFYEKYQEKYRRIGSVK
ncbi:MAG: amidohydrolase family protein [Ignavibacteriae bacterium]|nr:amidohydrolase family protein [Ignavibacteria bacterium]MBI3365292.1 amidohydrolase family protein [Ignavibacteriota bacterium]